MTTVHATGQTQDYCDTKDVEGEPYESYSIRMEKKVREKCKEGDIIKVEGVDLIARLCDLNKTVASICNSARAVCFLAPPRKVY